jgi:hypothetical protein
MMVVVALVALSMGVVRLLQYRAVYLRASAHNAKWEAIYSELEQGWKERLESLQGTLKSEDPTAASQIASAQQSIHGSSAMLAIFTARRRINDRLASHPWESVPRDPLEKEIDEEEPVLLFENSSGSIYEFSARSIGLLTISPIIGVIVYVSLRMAKRRQIG